MWRFLGIVLATLLVAFITACAQLAWADASASAPDRSSDPGWTPVEAAPEAPAPVPDPAPFRLAERAAPRGPERV